MSSPAAFAGQKPMMAFGSNQRSATICFSMVLRVFVELARRRTLLLVIENFREMAAQFPGTEEGCPIDIGISSSTS